MIQKAEPSKKQDENLIKFHAAFAADTAIQNVTRQPKILRGPINFHCPSGGELVSGSHATLPKNYMAQAGKEQAEQELAIQDSKTANLIKGIYVFYCQLRLTLQFLHYSRRSGKVAGERLYRMLAPKFFFNSFKCR